ncbi:MAG: hypothetical protein LBB58_05005, partial [Cellulomonadaceae bacterium]|nr:hypothetical protein [Cellulomonadaceae bacterium]
MTNLHRRFTATLLTGAIALTCFGAAAPAFASPAMQQNLQAAKLPTATKFAKYNVDLIGTLAVGNTLTAYASYYFDDEAPGTINRPANADAKLTYQWLRDGKAISGATKKTYALQKADAGKKVSVKITATKAGLGTQAKESKRYAILAKAPEPTKAEKSLYLGMTLEKALSVMGQPNEWKCAKSNGVKANSSASTFLSHGCSRLDFANISIWVSGAKMSNGDMFGEGVIYEIEFGAKAIAKEPTPHDGWCDMGVTGIPAEWQKLHIGTPITKSLLRQYPYWSTYT